MANHSNKPKFPNIQVKLIGFDGNAFSILGRVKKELRRHEVSTEEVKTFMAEAMSGDYDHLLATVMRWVDVR